MKAKLKKQWLKALRSGKYNQGRANLVKSTETQIHHCCLGVLCDVLVQNGKDMTYVQEENSYEGFMYSKHNLLMLDDLTSDLRKDIGISEEIQNKLIKMNDEYFCTFEEIADYIEKEKI